MKFYKSLLVLLFISIILVGCKPPSDDTIVKKDEVPSIKVVKSEEIEIDDKISFDASITSNKDVNLYPPPSYNGRIKSFYLTEGMFVNKGALVAEIDLKDITGQDYLLSKVYSTATGFVTKTYVVAGDIVSSLSKIATVSQINPVIISFRVYEKDLTKITEGQKCLVQIDSLENEIEAKITRKFPSLKSNNRSLTCEIELPNAKNEIRPGMTVKVSAILGKKNAIFIPNDTIIKLSNFYSCFVYNLKDSTISKRNLVIGSQKDEKTTEVISGINKDDFIVTNIRSNYKDGLKVKVEGDLIAQDNSNTVK